MWDAVNLLLLNGGLGRTRTYDQRIMSPRFDLLNSLNQRAFLTSSRNIATSKTTFPHGNTSDSTERLMVGFTTLVAQALP